MEFKYLICAYSYIQVVKSVRLSNHTDEEKFELQNRCVKRDDSLNSCRADKLVICMFIIQLVSQKIYWGF